MALRIFVSVRVAQGLQKGCEAGSVTVRGGDDVDIEIFLQRLFTVPVLADGVL